MKTYTGLLGLQIPTLRWFNFLYVVAFLCKELATHEETIFYSDNVLCKFCFTDAADLNYIFTKKSPVAIKQGNQTLSGRPVFVQTFKNPDDFNYDIITVRKSNCVGYGPWVRANTWFPGYAWKFCICQSREHFLGWIFEPFGTAVKSQKVASDKGFYALIIQNILGEEFSDSLFIVPKRLLS